jgi:RNA polymerase sigma-54 factor
MAMRFEQSASMKLGQQMKLAPRVIQSMEILQMPLAELEERIEQELESNATLELAEPQREPDAPDHGPEQTGTDSDSFARLDDYASDAPDANANTFDAWEPGPRANARLSGEPDAKSEALAQAPDRESTLHEQLLAQWRLAEADESITAAGAVLIGFLDDDGYLRTPLDEIARRAPAHLGLNPEILAAALPVVQLVLEPAGTAARDVRECLLLQLDAMDEPGADHDRQVRAAARLLIEHHLDDLSKNRVPQAAQAAGLSMPLVRAAMDFMHRLSLAPARALAPARREFVMPDAIVEYDEEQDRYIAYLVDRRHANLRVNEQYARLAADKTMDQKDREFIRTNVSNAQWLIEAVQQRASTLLRVIRVVVDAQRDYFDYGPEQLKPLPMTQVADQLGVHVATVSRAVADKHLQTPRGIVPLRGFFSGGLATDSGGEVSYDAVKATLKEIVEAEDKAKPLSDDALAGVLKDRGIEIARRTVAKYRDQLGIPSAKLRKKH